MLNVCNSGVLCLPASGPLSFPHLQPPFLPAQAACPVAEAADAALERILPAVGIDGRFSAGQSE